MSIDSGTGCVTKDPTTLRISDARQIEGNMTNIEIPLTHNGNKDSAIPPNVPRA